MPALAIASTFELPGETFAVVISAGDWLAGDPIVPVIIPAAPHLQKTVTIPTANTGDILRDTTDLAFIERSVEASPP